MKYVKLTYDEAHRLVEANKFLEWDGWDIKTWRQDPNGFSDTRGEFRNGKWGIKFTYAVRKDGTWSVPVSYVDRAGK